MSSETKTYNGWTNYETWNVALWLDNEQGSQRYWQGEARTACEDAEATTYSTRLEVAARALAERLKEEIEESAPDLGASMFSDLLGAALSEVNWDEIASHYVDEEMPGVLEDETPDEDDDSEDA
jgi:hypothetical protein